MFDVTMQSLNCVAIVTFTVGILWFAYSVNSACKSGMEALVKTTGYVVMYLCSQKLAFHMYELHADQLAIAHVTLLD